jgi:hypothetical protein
MLTYAQNFEDVMLARLFGEQSSGFYIDIGAWHPTELSVTKHEFRLLRGLDYYPCKREIGGAPPGWLNLRRKTTP